MPKPTIHDDMPDAVRKAIDDALRFGARVSGPNGETNVPAAGQLHAMHVAFTRGYYWPESAVTTPHLDHWEQLRETDPSGALRHQRDYGLDISFEERCRMKARALLAWSQEPSTAELAEIAKAKREAEEQQQAIEARADEIMAADADKRRAKAIAAARKQITTAAERG